MGKCCSPVLTATNGSSVDIELDQNVASLAPGTYIGTYTFFSTVWIKRDVYPTDRDG